MPRTTLPRRATLPALAGLLLLGAGCARSQGDAPPEQAATPAAGARVPFVQPQRRALERVVEQPGTVRAYEETPIFAKLAGYVTRVNADIGDEVKGPRYDKSGELVEPGQVLAVIAMPELEQEAQQKEALVAQARAEQE
ncbi:MAG TPA: hypothetical protein VIL46_06675, partial [Gemmataceae bacterium]